MRPRTRAWGGEGDVAAGLAQAATRVEAEYAVPFLGHATLEPQNCTAHVTRDKVEIWAPTQNGEATLAAAAQAAGVPARNVVVHKCMLGGGFGRRGAMQDFVSLAVRIARQVERPVKVIWTREEDTRHDFYRPVAMARMAAGLDATGLPLAWHVRMTGQSIMAMMRPLPGGVDKHSRRLPGRHALRRPELSRRLCDADDARAGRVLALRQPHAELLLQGKLHRRIGARRRPDPYHYRRKMLRQHPRAARLGVLDAAAARAGWDTPLPPGVHRGIALNEVNGTYNAAVIEVSVGGDALRVHRVVSAIDCGHVVNPMTVEMQVESATVYALTGRALRRNHHQGRPRGAIELPRLPDAAAGADAQGRNVIVPSGGWAASASPGCGGRAGAV